MCVFVAVQAGLIGMLSLQFSSVAHSVTLPCLGPATPLQKYLLLSYSFPILLLLAWALCYLTMYAHAAHHKTVLRTTQLYHTLWQIILLCYTSVNAGGMGLGYCTRVGDTEVLVADKAVVCKGSSYAAATAAGLFVSASVSVLLPAYIVWCHSRRKLVYWHMGAVVVPEPASIQTELKTISNAVVPVGVSEPAPTLPPLLPSPTRVGDVLKAMSKRLDPDAAVRGVLWTAQREEGAPEQSGEKAVEQPAASSEHTQRSNARRGSFKAQRVSAAGDIIEFDIAHDEMSDTVTRLPEYVGAPRQGKQPHAVVGLRSITSFRIDTAAGASVDVPVPAVPASRSSSVSNTLAQGPHSSVESVAEVAYVDGVPVIGLPIRPLTPVGGE